MALTDKNYDMSKLKNGVWNDGRIAYKKKSVNVSSDISHHGVKGMHWGIRKADNTVAKTSKGIKTGEDVTDETISVLAMDLADDR